jgi:hypothetical protein
MVNLYKFNDNNTEMIYELYLCGHQWIFIIIDHINIY